MSNQKIKGGGLEVSYETHRKTDFCRNVLTENMFHLLSYLGTVSFTYLVAQRPIHSLYLRCGGGGRIRTCVALRAADLQSAPINHSGTPPNATP